MFLGKFAELRFNVASLVLGVALVVTTGCSKIELLKATGGPARSCSAISGSAWTPAASIGASAANLDPAVLASRTELGSYSARIIGKSQDLSTQLATIDFNIGDLGDSGSFTLVAETTSFPSNLAGGADPVLVELKRIETSSGVAIANQPDWVKVTGCSNGFGSTLCKPTASLSAFFDRDDWRTKQIGSYAYLSSNSFPTCRWSATSPKSCPFVQVPFFEETQASPQKFRLPPGKYRAKYALVADGYSTLSSSYNGGIEITLVTKTDATLASGSLNLNVVLVGSANIAASHTDAGKRNLDALFTQVAAHFSQVGTGIKLGGIQVYEWTCEQDGDLYAEPHYWEMGSVFYLGSSQIGTSEDGKSLNLFFVDSILDQGNNSTILGLSGSVAGPPINGTAQSGVGVALNGRLKDFNPRCSNSNCPASLQEADFVDLASTIVHESGHYLGLYHPTESDGVTHDPIPDTPTCGPGGAGYVTHSSCRSTNVTCTAECPTYNGTTTFCPAATNCQFNHVMWWTSKKYDANDGSVGDANLISSNSSEILNYSAFTR